MKGSLALRVRHKEGETGLSLALRLAARSGVPWGGFANAVGLPVSGLRMSCHLERLSELSGVAADRLRPLTPVWHGWGRPMEVAGLNVDPSRFLRLNLRVCPLCMREDVERCAEHEQPSDAPYLRMAWSLAFMFGCERHGSRLVNRCPGCAERPKWNVGRVSECHCGQSLLGVEPTALGGSELAILRAMAVRLRGRAPASDVLSGLDGLALPDLVNMLRFLGELAIDRVGRRPACALEADDLPELMSAGLETLDALPGSFASLLDRVERRSVAGAHRLSDRYGIPLVRWLGSDHPYAPVLRPIFEGHASARGLAPLISPKARSGWWNTDSNPQPRRIDERGFERLVAATNWVGPPPVKRQDILAIERKRGAILTQTEATAFFGVQRTTFLHIEKCGIVEATWPKGRGKINHFYRVELEILLDQLRMDAPIMTWKKKSLVQITRAANGPRLASLLLLMIKGQLHCAGVLQDRQGLQSLLVRKDDLPSSSRKSAEGTMVGASVCRTIGVTTKLLYMLRAAGYLKVIVGGPYRSTSTDEVAEFSRRFVSCAHLAKALRLDGSVVRARLRQVGVSGLLDKEGANLFPWLEVVRAIPRIMD